MIPVNYNYFNSTTNMLNNSNIFPNKMKNLHGCPIKVVTYNAEPNMILTQHKNGTYYTGGIDGKILRFLSKRLNFYADIIVPSDGTKKGMYYSLSFNYEFSSLIYNSHTNRVSITKRYNNWGH